MLQVRDLERDARAIGVRVSMEVRGQCRPGKLRSAERRAVDWVPMGAVLDRLRPKTGLPRIRITGVDDDTTPSVTSNPGANWIFLPTNCRRLARSSHFA